MSCDRVDSRQHEKSTMKNSSFLSSATLGSTITGPTSSTDIQTLDLPLVIVLCTVLGVASLVGTLGNTLVLLSIIKFDNLRDIADLFIFSLSLSDFLVVALYQPLRLFRLAHLAEVSTQMDVLTISSSFLGHVSLIASVSNMFGVTVERLISIRFPLKYDFLVTKRRAVLSVIFIWIFSIAYGGIWSQRLAPESYLSVYFIVILVGTISIYLYIFLIAKRLEGSVAQIPQNRSTEAERLSSRKNRKAAKTIAIILGVAIACWLPLLIVPSALANDPDRSKFFIVFNFLHVLSVCNSSINPYIYCARSRRYYVAFIKVLGLHKALSKKIQVAGVSKSLQHDFGSSVRNVFQEIQPSKGEIYDSAL